MKEREFLEKMRGILNITIPIYYAVDENDEMIVDFESIRDECEDKIKKIKEVLENGYK